MLITTPTRLLENLNSNKVNFNRTKVFMIEECDIIFESMNREMTECMNKFKRSEGQRLVGDWRFFLFSRFYHRKMDSFLKVRKWKVKSKPENVSIIFADLFQGTTFMGANNCPLICSPKSPEKYQLAFRVLDVNCAENSNVVFLCSHEETCLYLSSRLFDEGYNVVRMIHGKIDSRLQPENQLDNLKKSVTIVVTTDSGLASLREIELAFDVVVFYEGVDYHHLDAEFVLSRRCSVLLTALSEQRAAKPKVFHFISERETVSYITMLNEKLKTSGNLNCLKGNVGKNFQDMVEEMFVNYEKQKIKPGKVFSLCDSMLLHPRYATVSKRFINCGNLSCEQRHQILPTDWPGNDPKHVKLPTHGYFRIRVRQVTGANSFFATLDDYREKQTEPYQEFSRDVLRQIEDEIDDCVPFLKLVDPKSVKAGKLYLIKRNRILHRAVVTKFQSTNSFGHPTSVDVFRVDVGDTIFDIQISNVHEIPKIERDVRRIPGQAFKVIILGLTGVDGKLDFPPQIVKYVEDKIQGKLLEGMIVLSLSNVMFVHLLTLREKMADGSYPKAGYRIKNDLLEMKYCVKNDNQMFLIHEAAKELFEELPVLKKLLAATDIRYHEDDKLSQGEFSPCYLVASHTKKNINEFFVIKRETLAGIEKLNERIAKEAPSYNAVAQTEPGKYLVANVKRKESSSANTWARAKVVRVNVVKKEANVLLIDTGEMHVVKYSRLKVCPNDVFVLPSAAIGCCLVGIRPVEAAYGYRHEFREFLKELSNYEEYEIAAYPAPDSSNSKSSLIAVELFYKTTKASSPKLARSSAKHATLSKVMCSRGLAVGLAETMDPIFNSSFKSKLLKFHIATELTDADRATMFQEIFSKWGEFPVLDEVEDENDKLKLAEDLVIVLTSYQSTKVLHVALVVFVIVSKLVVISEQMISRVLEKCMHDLKNPTVEILEKFHELLASLDKEMVNNVSQSALRAFLKQFLQNGLKIEIVKVLIAFFEGIDFAQVSETEIENCVSCFTTLMRNHSLKNLPNLAKVIDGISKERFDSLVKSFNYSPSFLQLYVQNYSETLDKVTKVSMIKVMTKFMAVQSLKIVVGNSNALLESLEQDCSNSGNIATKIQAKKLLNAIMTYKKELVSSSLANHIGGSATQEETVKDLSELNIDLTYYQKLTPKAIWWQNENSVTIRVEIFGIRAKRTKYKSDSVVFEALTNDDKLYCLNMDLAEEIVQMDSGRALEKVSGRSFQIEITKKKPKMWDHLTTTRLSNIVYDIEKMAQFEENNNNSQTVNWTKNRGAYCFKNCVPDVDLPRSSGSESGKESDDDGYAQDSDGLLSGDE